MSLMEEPKYRQIVDEVFRRIDAAFEDVDPDLAESVNAQGTLTIVYRERLRFILSPQAPLRQIWAAFKDRAWHFNLDPKTGVWLDDKGQGVELLELVEETTRGQVGVDVKVQR